MIWIAAAANDVSVVRRVSGGGTIYHAEELTYSIVCSPEHIPSTASVKDSFRVLTGFLIDFYGMLGLQARYAVDTVPDAERLGERTAFCFAGKETFDILIRWQEDWRQCPAASQKCYFSAWVDSGYQPCAVTDCSS